MAKYLRYMGEFLSRAGVCWRAEILQESNSAFDEIGVLTFEATEALVIEYPNTAKEDVICGSTATIQIESPGDRTYEDLYTIETGAIRLDVYRNGVLYWSGTLDPEFYEEPYERAANYVVSLTFSDFGVLDRLKYTLSGMLTLDEIVRYCLAETSINYGGIDESLISTSVKPGGAAMKLNSLKVRSDNFYDEDGEAMSLKEVIEGILQPLGLRMVQRNGKVFVYDLNGLYSKANMAEAVWSGASSTMGVDVVYNNAKITWSTYAQSGTLTVQECWTEETDPNLMNLNNIWPQIYEGSEYYSYHYSTNLKDWIDDTNCGFTIYLNHKGVNATITDKFRNSNVRFFKIVPQYDGTESEGIAISLRAVRGYKVGNSANWSAGYQAAGMGVDTLYLAGTLKDIDEAIFKNTPVWIPPVDKSDRLRIRVCLELLVDPRFNPFEQAANFLSGVKQADYQKQWKARGNYLYVPVSIKFQPDGSDKVYIWTNRSVVKSDVKNNQIRTLDGTYGEWRLYDNTKDAHPEEWGYLCYYKPEDRKEDSGVAQGWAVNRQAINPHTGQITTILEHAEDGQLIPYPNVGAGGKIWIEVRGKGWQISDGNVNLSDSKIIDTYKLWGGGNDMKISWILAKLPTIEIVNNAQFEQTISTDDVEYSAELNAAAKDPIELDTICGSSAEGVPTARGAYFNAQTGEQIRQLTRAGRTTQIEELLIGTLYSQYAERRTQLSGEIELHPDGLVSYKEQNQEGKKFILTAETQDVIMDTTEATLIELRPDEYDKKK